MLCGDFPRRLRRQSPVPSGSKRSDPEICTKSRSLFFFENIFCLNCEAIEVVKSTEGEGVKNLLFAALSSTTPYALLQIPSSTMAAVVRPSHSSSGMAIVSPLYCSECPVDLTITQNRRPQDGAVLTATDANGSLLFTVEEKASSPVHHWRFLLDSGGNAVLFIKAKTMTLHKRYEVFRGSSSSDADDLLFSARKSTFFQLQKVYDVFMASNAEEQECDFRIRGNYLDRSCTVCVGRSNTAIAKVSRKRTAANLLLERETFSVAVSPGVDCAFVVALIAILDGINAGKDSCGVNLHIG